MSDLKRVTVNLTPRAQRALEEIIRVLGGNPTDVINAALSSHAALTEYETKQGFVSVIIPPKDELARPPAEGSSKADDEADRAECETCPKSAHPKTARLYFTG